MPILAGRCDSLQNALNGPGQTPTLPADELETPIPESGDAECVALSDESPQATHSDPALDELIRAWPALSGWTRWQIRELIDNQTQSNTQTGIHAEGEQD